MASSKPRPPLPKGPFLVVGLARSGQAIARVLAGLGESVTGIDAGHPEGAERLRELGVEVHLDGDWDGFVDSAGCLVKSPGVPRSAPAVARALVTGVEVVGELELAWRLLPNRFIAVTGTNGKTTAAELLGHVWRECGRPVAVAGNVGTPVASLAGELEPSATVVCECSSFQLEDSERFAPEVAAILNVAPDHLDRHGSMESYLAAKLRAFANQSADDVAVVNRSDPALRRLTPGAARSVGFCDAPGAGCDVNLDGGRILAFGAPLIDLAELRMAGRHNAMNAAAVAAIALTEGLDRDRVAGALASFAGVPHRLETVAEIGGVRYVNDSKATNVAAAAAALRSFDGSVLAIMGGSLKGEGFEALNEPLIERCRACYLTGPAAEPMGRDIAPAAAAGVEVRHAKSLEAAVRAAAADAGPGEIVLLAPACASFDAFRDYAERGDAFRAAVAELGTGT